MAPVLNRQLNSIFERILRDKNGVLVRVRFTVVETNGVFTPQIISIAPVVAQARTQTEIKETVCLPTTQTPKVIAEDATSSFISKISPYFTLDFFMSQPTRAPSL